MKSYFGAGFPELWPRFTPDSGSSQDSQTAELSLGGALGRGRPAQGLPWYTCFRRVRIHSRLHKSVPEFPHPAGSNTFLTLGVPVIPAPGVGLLWKLGPRHAGRLCRLACEVRHGHLPPVTRATDTHTYTHAEPRPFTGISSCAPRESTGALCNPGKGWGHICNRTHQGQALPLNKSSLEKKPKKVEEYKKSK